MFSPLSRLLAPTPRGARLGFVAILAMALTSHPAEAGFLLVRAEGSQVLVVLDGEAIGFSPLLQTDIPPGPHELGFKVSRFGPMVVHRSVQIPEQGGLQVKASLAAASLTATLATEDAEPWPVQPTPEGPTGEIYIATTEPDAWITLDNKDLGIQAPALLKSIPPGEHQVRLRSACGAAEAPALVKEQIITRLEMELQEGTGILELFTTPAEVAVTVDGIARGNTPQAIADLSCGEHTVELSQSAYYTEALTVFVPAFDRTPVYATLQPIENGTLVISPEPLDTTVILDGRELGQGPMSLENMLAGSHELVLRREGYEDRLQIVEVATDKVTRVEAALSPSPQQEPEATASTPPTEPAPPQATTDPQSLAATPEPTAKKNGGRILLDSAVTLTAVGLSALAGYTFVQAMDAYQRHQDEPDKAKYERIYTDEFQPLYRQSLVEGAVAVALLGTSTVLWARTGKVSLGAGPAWGLSVSSPW